MAQPRGPTGAVNGIPAAEVNELLARVARKLGRQEGRRFTRADVRAELVKAGRKDGRRVLDNLVLALLRSTGAVALGGGDYWLPDDAELYARNRSWRMHVGKLGPADAHVLHRALTGAKMDHTTPRLEEVRKRLQAGLRGMGLT